MFKSAKMKHKLVCHNIHNILILMLVSLQGLTQVSGCFSKHETRAQLKRLSGNIDIIGDESA